MSAVVIRDALGVIGGAKGYIGVAPSKAVAPYFVVNRVSGSRDVALAGPTGGRAGVYQVDSYAATYTDADRLAGAAADLMAEQQDKFTLGGVDELPDDFDSAAGLFRISVEFSVQF
ncbi:tail completion protein gp17 [Burkholderia gladioli]|uniref:tail completion protein gp17 n=1 Tax=Burkholderia gladioli TaxID=28095 RepID=UPI00163E5EC5|nr:DUF3168 domain-containing protein [Burkholderia gladioli]